MTKPIEAPFRALSDRIGRRPVSIIGAVLLLASARPFFRILDTGETWAIWVALFVTLGAGQAAILGSQPAFFAELFDTSVRFSAVGIANNIGTVLTGGLAPMLCSALLLWYDHNITGVVIFIALLSVVTIVTVGLARETRYTGSSDEAATAPRGLQQAL
ncbi:MFS transporter [Streptomyces fungicidicus]